MATAMTVQPLAPRPSPRAIVPWSPPRKHLIEGKENRPALKQIPQSPTAARSRRDRPCDGCRKRKSKCVLQEDRRCVLCEFHKQECTFVANAQPRKRKVDSNAPAAISPVTTDSSSTTLSSPRQEIRTTTANETAIPSVQQRDSVMPSESLGLQRHHHCKYLGQTTALDASLIGLGSFDDRMETTTLAGTLKQVSSHEYFSIHAEEDLSLREREARALADIEATVGHHVPALIELYFRNVHPYYPVLRKDAFSAQPKPGDGQFTAPLLAAIYLLALNWWSSDPDLAQQPKPDVNRLEYIALTSLTTALQRPTLATVQAGLLYLQRAKSSTWNLTVQLIAIGQDVGLHLDCSDWSTPLQERRLRKRLAWALYMQDKWSALTHGRPSHINAEDWAVQPLTDEDFDDTICIQTEDITPETIKGRILFTQMIALTTIMSDVCQTFYSQTAKRDFARASPHTQTQIVLNRAKPVQIKLKEWFSKLPPECKIDSTTTSNTLHRNHIDSTPSLHLAYFATEISIHRRIISSLDPTTSDPYLTYICRSAAKTRLIGAMEFVNRLHPDQLARSFWFAASAANFALIGTFGALLMATAPAREEAEFYRLRLGEFRWTLRVCAKRAEWMNGAGEVLEGSLELLSGLPLKGDVEEVRARRAEGEVGGGGSGSGVVNGRSWDGEDEGEEMDVDELDGERT